MDSHHSFQAKHQIPFPLLSDQGGALCRSYGVLNPLGFIQRSTFIIDENGILAKIYRKVKVKGHVDDILHVLRERQKKS